MKKRFNHGMSMHPLYTTWSGMKTRCANKNHRNYEIYGGKGVKVCERWMNFQNFVEDMGDKPSPHHTLDRIDGSGDYEPSNCRWATAKEQGQNTSRLRFIEINGEKKCLAEWLRVFGLKKATVASRLRYGWGVKKALTTPTPNDLRTRRHKK